MILFKIVLKIFIIKECNLKHIYMIICKYYNHVFKIVINENIIYFLYRKTEQHDDHLYFFFYSQYSTYIFLIEFYLIDTNIHFYGLYTL